MIFQPQYFYHFTSCKNAISILKDKHLTYGKGVEVWMENFVSLSDYLHYDLADFGFGDLCFEFQAINLLLKNEIYPYDFQIENEKYLDSEGNLLYGMWECEWVAKKIIFDYADISNFIFSIKSLYSLSKKEIINLENLLNANGVQIKKIDFEKLPQKKNQFFVERYLQRIKYPLASVS